jgi:nicotinate-nucleotide pyrophosphorylase
MRVLLDECLPRRLKAELPDYQVRTAQEEGWAGLKNGDLLRVAAGQFHVLLTVDRNIAFQQNLSGLSIAVIAMVARSNRLDDLRPVMVEVRRVLPGVRAGQVIRVGG